MSVCLISGVVQDPSLTPISGLAVTFNTQTPVLAAEPVQGSTTTASDGTWSMSLLQGLSGIFTINSRVTPISRTTTYTFNVNVPLTSTANFSDIVVDS